MADTKISAGADPGTLVATDKVPMARSASTTAYAATMAELATYANGAYVPNYYSGTPAMDGTGAAGTAAFVSRGDHVHPSDATRLPLSGGTLTGPLVLASGSTAPTPTTGDSTTKIATTAFVQAQMVASGAGVSTWNTRAGAVVLQQSDITAVGALHDVGRNLLHNPLFNVAQRGAGAWTTSAAFLADRWQLNFNLDTGVAVNIVAATDALRSQTGDEATEFVLQNSFTGNAGAASYTLIWQRIEDVKRLSGKTVTVSFWAWCAAGTPKLGVSVDQQFGTGGSPSAPVSGNGQAVTISTTATRYTATFAVPSSAGKTFGTTAGSDFTQLNFWYSSGTTQATRAGSIGVQAAVIAIWGVQLEIGTAATPLEKPDPPQDLAKCQRFYQTFSGRMDGYQLTNGYVGWTVALPVTMRATPTVVPSFAGSGNASNSTVNALSAGAVQIYCQATATGGVINNVSMTLSADL